MKKTVYLPVPPELKEKVPYIELTIMPAAERFAEKEVARQQDYDDIQSGRCTPQEVNDRNAIDWGPIKVRSECPDYLGWD